MKSRKSFFEMSKRSQKKRVDLMTKMDQEKISGMLNFTDQICIPALSTSEMSIDECRGQSPVQSDGCAADDVDVQENGSSESVPIFANEERDDFFNSDSDDSNIDDDLINTGLVFEDHPQNFKHENLRSFLQEFSVMFDIKANAMTHLLKGLRQFGHEELPACARTLMNTPRTSAVENLDDCKNEKPDNCCYLKDGSIVVIDFITQSHGRTIIIGKKFMNCQKIDYYPIDSTLLNIVSATDFDNNLVQYFADDIKQKGHKHCQSAKNNFFCNCAAEPAIIINTSCTA